MNNAPKILILGAGKVAMPMVKYLLSKRHRVTVASEYLYQAELIINNHPLGTAIEWNASEISRLNYLVKEHKVVVSLLPYHLHVLVCEVCIKQRRSLVTTSYQQSGMGQLHSDACKSNITILNEMGLDPGIDHMWASKIIDSIKDRGGEVEKFMSVCGALPVPDSLDNPFRYKFSWSPIGVMKASSSQAKYLKSEQIIDHSSTDLMKNTFGLNIDGLGELEAYANRDSLKYIDLYQLPNVKTFFRGTLRYKGWCEAVDTLIEVGYLSEQPFPTEINTYAQLTSHLTKIDDIDNLRDAFAKKLKIETYSNAIMAMEWVGLFSHVHFSVEAKSPMEVLTNRMVSKMKMLPSDKDLVILNHQIQYKLPDKTRKVIKGTLKMQGKNNENTAIAKTVSYPAALATELFLKKGIAHKGIVRPLYKEIYDPVLSGLSKDFNFEFEELETDVSSWPENW